MNALTKQLLFSIFWASLVFWGILFGHMLLENLAAQNNAIALALVSIPALPVAAIAGIFVFGWRFIENGFWHFLLSICLIALVFGSYSFNQDSWLNIFGDVREKLVILFNQNWQKDNPIYQESSQIATEPFAIYYVDDGDPSTVVDPSLLEDLKAFVAILPSELLENPAALYLVEDQAFEMESSASENEVFGFSNNGTMSSSIKLVTNPNYLVYTELKNGAMVYLDDPSFYKETIIHELAHLMDMTAGAARTKYSDSDEFMAIYQADPWSISEYGATSAGEFFAEGAIYYYMYPELLQEKNPALFDYFNRLYGHY